MTGYGLIGFGRIGQRVAACMREQTGDLRLEAVLVRPGQACNVEGAAVCRDLDAFLARRPAIAVECASAAALAEWGPRVLAAGADLVPLSLAALADRDFEQRLSRAAMAGPGRLELAAGAMAGLDCLATAREGGLTKVTFRAVYPASRWIGTPAATSLDLASLTRRTGFFQGTAREAARLYPRHLNLCVGVALAGLGLDATTVELFADPALRQASFEVEARAAAGDITLHIGPRDAPEGADPADHTAFSIVRLLRRRSARIAI